MGPLFLTVSRRTGRQAHFVQVLGHLKMLPQRRKGFASPVLELPVIAAPPAPRQATTSSPKTAKTVSPKGEPIKQACRARGTTDKTYVEQCRNGGVIPTATAPTPTAAPAPARPARPLHRVRLRGKPVIFADDASAKASCPTATVVWVNLPSRSVISRELKATRDEARRLHVRKASDRN